MNPFDQKFLQITLDSMKLAQGSLQQIMTLSAGALALFMGFSGKIQPSIYAKVFAVLVVAFWIISLCSAAAAHLLHTKLFRSLCNFSNAIEKILLLESELDKMIEVAANSIDREKAMEAARQKLESGRTKFELESQAFEAVFFPMQDRSASLMGVSIKSLVVGFIFLGAAFVLQQLNA